jgi:hypothetical protein
MCGEAIVAQIAFCDRKTNLFLDFGIESSCLECAAKVEVGFKGCRRLPSTRKRFGTKPNRARISSNICFVLPVALLGSRGEMRFRFFDALIFLLFSGKREHHPRNMLHAKRL